MQEVRRHPNGTLSRRTNKNNNEDDDDDTTSNRYNRCHPHRKKTVTLGIFGDGHVPAKLFYAQVERTQHYVAVAQLRVQQQAGRHPHQYPPPMDTLHHAVVQETHFTQEDIIEYLHDAHYVYIVYNVTVV
mmetsp:Transcript_9644/g.11541  ORF Transcript_9644/g.11541 Transcript_9644/m.11541 type:complete len:130 (+) Transcript_9644:59-448(+)